MNKFEKILERYKIYLGVRDVAVEIRPYKTRSAFTNLASSPPTIYLNKASAGSAVAGEGEADSALHSH
jgi:hypothetical protein